ncbi:hypothetical protein [Halalkalicoccus tibetensis]|uniref:CBS domain-containing protein n=1 Tax=Halalkalicoccus tibetensis TaxID=175632 RepID=A0ABD5VAL3_9EURY
MNCAPIALKTGTVQPILVASILFLKKPTTDFPSSTDLLDALTDRALFPAVFGDQSSDFSPSGIPKSAHFVFVYRPACTFRFASDTPTEVLGILSKDSLVKLLKALDVSFLQPVDPSIDDTVGITSVIPEVVTFRFCLEKLREPVLERRRS